MSHDLSLSEMQKHWHGTLKAYVIGFILSIVLTGASFFLVAFKIFTGLVLIFTVVGLGLAQAIVQLLFFLHLGQEAKPRWELVVFLFMVMVLLIIVLGSLWIMYDLDQRMMQGMMLEMHPKGDTL